MNNIDYNTTLQFYIKNLRETRNKLLIESDKYLISDYPITNEKIELIKNYRQQLRNYMNLDEIINYNYSCNIMHPPMPQFPF